MKLIKGDTVKITSTVSLCSGEIGTVEIVHDDGVSVNMPSGATMFFNYREVTKDATAHKYTVVYLERYPLSDVTGAFYDYVETNNLTELLATKYKDKLVEVVFHSWCCPI